MDNTVTNNIIDEIINKTFTVAFKGYDATEVDKFLDYLVFIIKNYQQEIAKLKQINEEQLIKIISFEKEMQKVYDEVSLLRREKQALEAKGVQNADIITRLSKLESIVND